MVCFDLGLCCVRKYCSRKAYSQILTMLTTWQWDFKSFYHVLFFEDFFLLGFFFVLVFSFVLLCFNISNAEFQKDKDRKKDVASTGLFPKWLQYPGVDQDKISSSWSYMWLYVLLYMLPCGYVSPSTWAILTVFPGAPADNWIGSVAARPTISSHVGSWHYTIALFPPFRIFLPNIIF